MKDYKWQAEFNMGELDFRRFDIILKNVDQFGFMVFNGDTNAIRPYYSSLHQLFNNWKCLILKAVVQDIEEKFNESSLLISQIDEDKSNSRHPNPRTVNRVVSLLDWINCTLIDVKQKIGIGIPLTTSRSEKTNIENYLGV